MVLGDGALGRLLDHKGGALINGISALKKETWELPTPSTLRRWMSIKGALKDIKSDSALILDVQLPEVWENKLLFV